MTKKYEQIAYDEAKQSRCLERQVGAVLVDAWGNVISQGHNYSQSCVCNNLNGMADADYSSEIECPSNVVHAEIDCLNGAKHSPSVTWTVPLTMYITQPPCNNCLDAIDKFASELSIPIKLNICEQFLKFDDDKIRFELIPPEWELALAKVLTYGAKKYKPDNWRKGEISRYHGAVMRHWNAYRSGEWLDPETNMPHLWHMFTNVGFLITLETAARLTK